MRRLRLSMLVVSVASVAGQINRLLGERTGGTAI